MDKIIRVLVVDDSALMREVICDVLAGLPDIVVVGVARDGHEALVKVEDLQPDIVTLDLHMPGMDGLATLDAILAQQPLPVIMVSSLTQRAAEITLQALERGALDYVPKPENLQANDGPFRVELLHKLRTMAGADVEQMLRIRRLRAERTAARGPLLPRTFATNATTAYQNCCVAIGISTGGPPALSNLFQSLAAPLPPIVVVQHMPANFTGPFARRLDSLSRLSIKEAETGDVLRPDHVLVAPGGRHLQLRRQGKEVIVEIFDSELVSGHRPSIDVMMHSAAAVFGSQCLGIIMTGMGHDGAAGCGAIRAAGGYVLGQDQETSDVYGMNRVAFVQGDVDRQFALNELPQLLPRQCAKMFSAAAHTKAARQAIATH
jgi:two-component system chemotaxis response regulator CheB